MYKLGCNEKQELRGRGVVAGTGGALDHGREGQQLAVGDDALPGDTR
jgi:hypothetical protein